MEIPECILLEPHPTTVSQECASHPEQAGGLLQDGEWTWELSCLGILETNEITEQVDQLGQGKRQIPDYLRTSVQEPGILVRFPHHPRNHSFLDERPEDGLDHLPKLQELRKDARTHFLNH